MHGRKKMWSVNQRSPQAAEGSRQVNKSKRTIKEEMGQEAPWCENWCETFTTNILQVS